MSTWVVLKQSGDPHSDVFLGEFATATEAARVARQHLPWVVVFEVDEEGLVLNELVLGEANEHYTLPFS